ncbi:MFS transporter [Tsukamurella pulmonis]|uniref:Drug resistance transporter, EmrB/QacA subfamily n=1 Tax=Tsukamurella pulmonis TaxID=47312 RepID=A0A1H1HH76_9ACTN|nr:MFS transporter [Tsukamurella pulmonis]KXO94711.1 MFS transporter [Tsukamurella pulmonis]SDR24719.1 drug resistance transporter, EmrB/QacA subfamily [Tsukamurella pulmonis]SUP14651.1 Spectinomycin tetracycline efflux pump [Tsukamurella pulmonis]
MLLDTQKVPVRAALLLAGLSQFLVAFDASVTNVALRAIRDDVHFTPQGLSWVVNAYAIVFGGLLLLAGRLSDRFGPRALLRFGFALFTVASLGAYLCQEPWQVIVVRVLQGVGAAAIAPAAITSVALTFHEPAQRAKGFAAIAIGASVGGAVGVVLSGVLTDAFGWRTVIACGALVSAIGLALTYAAPGPVPGADRRTDWAGGVLATAGLTVLAYGIVAATDNGWGSARTLGWFAVAAVLLAVFVAAERRTAVPLVDFRVLGQREVLVPCLVFAFVVAGQFGAFYFVSLYLQMGLGYSATKTGLMFLPFSFGIIVAVQLATRLVSKIGARAVVAIGTALATVGFLLFAPLPADGDFLTAVLLPSLVTSVGIGLVFLPLPNIATAAVAPSAAGMVSGVLNTFRQVGGALGLAILVTVAAALGGDGGVFPGYRAALLVSAGLVAAAFAISLLLPAKQREAAR